MRGKVLFILLIVILTSCGGDYVPKPRGYYRFDFPQKEYQIFSNSCPYEFEYPVYGKIEAPSEIASENCWYNISFPEYKAKVHLTYIHLNGDLAKHSEDIRTIVYKHIVKANDIKENRISEPEKDVYGIGPLFTLWQLRRSLPTKCGTQSTTKIATLQIHDAFWHGYNPEQNF